MSGVCGLEEQGRELIDVSVAAIWFSKGPASFPRELCTNERGATILTQFVKSKLVVIREKYHFGQIHQPSGFL